jgi:serine/threonine-protein kinase HipA
MPEVSVLDVLLHGRPVGNLTLVQGLRTLFTFDQAYIDDLDRPTLSLSFKDQFGGLLTDIRPVQRVVPPFFSNLLPEGPLRTYLARRASVNEHREFFLLWLLGADLPGAVSVRPAAGQSLPPGLEETLEGERSHALRFSLAGVQLKFSALKNAGRGGGLTIPAEGTGGHWIVKLPSMQFPGMPENEFSMMAIARLMGMDVPETQLLDLDAIEGLPTGIGDIEGRAYAISRFDRSPAGPVHIEDFAQVFGLFPEEKYEHRTYRSIARVIGIEAGDEGAKEFIRRLVFNTLIGNADMHLKNWSLIYPDGRQAAVAPAYDLLSTVPYIPDDETAALRYSRTKKMTEFSRDELAHLAAKALLPEKLVMDAARETVGRFEEVWAAEKSHLPLDQKVIAAVEAHRDRVPIFKEFRSR